MNPVKRTSLSPKPIFGILWQGRFVYLQIAIIAAACWVLWPLRDASRLSDPRPPAYTPEPPDRQETLVIGADLFSPGMPGAVRVFVYDPDSGRPMPGVDVRAFMSPASRGQDGEPVFVGQTDDHGSAAIPFDIAADALGDYDLHIDATGPVGAQRVVHSFAVQRRVQLDLSTDNVSYHPGQTIYLHVSAIDATTGLPLSDQAIATSIADARGNVVCAETVTTSEFGLGAAQCELAGRVIAGTYRLRASLPVPDQLPLSTESTITVDPAPAPQFDLDIQTSSPYYIPGQRVLGTVRIAGEWSEPISGTQVTIEPSLGVSAQHDLRSIQGTTDRRGELAFAFDLPVSLTGAGDLAYADLSLVVEAVDQEGRITRREIRRPVALQAILVRGMAESGALKPGIANDIVFYATYPDNEPAICTLTFEADGQQVKLQTDPDGFARWSYTPTPDQSLILHVDAHDEQDRQGQISLSLSPQPGQHHLLLRSRQTVYVEAETLVLDVLAPDVEVVHVDLVLEGQTTATYSVPLAEGRGSLTIQAAPAGALTLYAYSLLPDGSFIDDAKTVTVLPQDRLRVDAQADRALYEPGETARLRIHVSDAAGTGLPSALAVTAADPMGADQLLPGSPSWPFWFDDAGADGVGLPISRLVRRSGVLARPRPMPNRVKSQFEAVAAARAARQQAFARLAETLVNAFAIVVVLIWVVVLLWMWRADAVTWRFLWSHLPLGIVVPPLALGAAILLAHFGHQIFGPGAVIILGLSWFGALLALLVHGWIRRDGAAQLVPAFLIAGCALGWGLFYAFAQGGFPGRSPALIGLSSWAAASLILTLLGAGLLRQHATSVAVATFATIVLIQSSVVGALLFGKTTTLVRQDIPNLDVDLTPNAAPAGPPVRFTAVPPGTLQPEGWSEPQLAWGTLFWHPAGQTDRQGQTEISIPVARSTHLFVQASTLSGERGTARVQLETHTPLAVEPALPAWLTAGDAFDVPIALLNMQPVSQTIQMTVTQATWFRLRAPGVGQQQVDVSAGDRGTVAVPIQVREWGLQTLTVTAWSSQTASQVITQQVAVIPDGKPVIQHYNRQTDELDTYKIRIPWSAIQGSDRISLRVYPGWSSILAEGLQAALAHKGLGEWVSRRVISPTKVATVMPYPTAFRGEALAQVLAETNHLVVLQDYLTRMRKGADHIRTGIDRALALNSQRLLAFETDQGGFSSFGQANADLIETASVLMSLVDLAELGVVDPGVIDRVAGWLLDQQAAEGTWTAQDLPPGWPHVPHPDLPVTAYVAWALIDAGHDRNPAVQAAIKVLDQYLAQAQDPYTVALVVHALSAFGAHSDAQLDGAIVHAASRLVEMAKVQDGMASWHGDLQTFDGAVLEAADAERTALAVLALLRTQTDPNLAAQGLAMLADSRDAFGTWGSPMATFWALEAFAAALRSEPKLVLHTQDATVRVSVGALRSDDQETSDMVIIPTGGEQDVVYVFNFDAPAKGYNDVRLQVTGGPIFYQLVAEYVLPWNQVPIPLPEEEAVSLTLSYDRTLFSVGETITATAGVALNRTGVSPLVVVEFALPPGTVPIEAEWRALVENGTIAHHERTDMGVRAYLVDLSGEQPVRFAYHVRGVTPSLAQTPPTWAIDAGSPQQPAWREPVEFDLRE